MNVVVDDGRLETLDAAWASRASFALLPAPHRLADPARWVAAVPEELQRDHVALLTSGSTGAPRLVVGARARIDGLAREIHRAQALESVAAAVIVLPLSYSYAFVNQWRWARVHERRAVLTRGFGETDAVIAALASTPASMVCFTGAQTRLVVERLAGHVFENVQRVNLAGSAISYAQWEAFTRLFPAARVFCNFGCTEAMPRLAVKEAAPTADPANVGAPLPGIAMQVSAEGALQFTSPYQAVGVVEEQEQEGSPVYRALVGWTPTGDLARAEADGTFTLLGRANAVFKRWGEKVSLAALARTVEGAWAGEAALYREIDPRGEPGCVLLLAPAPEAATLGAILQALRRHHPRAEWPLRVESVAALPRSANGKIDSAALPHLDGRQVHWSQRL